MNQTETTNVNDLIIDEICNHADANGDFAVSVEIDNNDGTTTAIEVCGRTEWHGYQEPDYFNGTGYWVTTHAEASVTSVDVSRYDDEGEEYPVEGIVIDEKGIESAVVDWLKS